MGTTTSTSASTSSSSGARTRSRSSSRGTTTEEEEDETRPDGTAEDAECLFLYQHLRVSGKETRSVMNAEGQTGGQTDTEAKEGSGSC